VPNRDGFAVKNAVVVLLILAAFGQFGVRTFRHRNEIPLWDFASVYSAARTWENGGNPYDRAAIRATWHQTTGHVSDNIEFWSSVYPPTSLTMLAPVAFWRPGAAMTLWLAIVLALLVLQFAALLDLAGLKLSFHDPRGLLLIAASLFAAPIQFGVLSGQPSTPAISLCIIAIWCIARQRDGLGGVLLGIACAFKPQIAAPFILYYLVLRRWRAVEPALVMIAMLSALSLTAMQLSHVNWMHGWAENVQQTLAVGGVNDRAPTGPFRDEIIDLQILLAAFVQRGYALRLAAGCVIAVQVAWYVRVAATRTMTITSRNSAPSTSSASADLLPLATLSALSLMAMYHRVYDAIILTLAFAWALAELYGRRRRFALTALALLCVFMVPFDVLSSITHRLPSLAALSDAWWWAAIVEPHYAWALLALTLSLLWTMGRPFAFARQSPVARRAAVAEQDEMDSATGHLISQ
jgi:hypothetical protein